MIEEQSFLRLTADDMSPVTILTLLLFKRHWAGVHQEVDSFCTSGDQFGRISPYPDPDFSTEHSLKIGKLNECKNTRVTQEACGLDTCPAKESVWRGIKQRSGVVPD